MAAYPKTEPTRIIPPFEPEPRNAEHGHYDTDISADSHPGTPSGISGETVREQIAELLTLLNNLVTGAIDLSDYFKLSGRSGGQIAYFSDTTNEGGTLFSNSTDNSGLEVQGNGTVWLRTKSGSVVIDHDPVNHSAQLDIFGDAASGDATLILSGSLTTMELFVGSVTAYIETVKGTDLDLRAGKDLLLNPDVSGDVVIPSFSSAGVIKNTAVGVLSGGNTIDIGDISFDHGDLGGLADDDHPGYFWLAGRNPGQVAYFGDATGIQGALYNNSVDLDGLVIDSDSVDIVRAGTSKFDVTDTNLISRVQHRFMNNAGIRLGNGDYSSAWWGTAQTAPGVVWGLADGAGGEASRYILFCDISDRTFDFGHTDFLDPTVLIHSANQNVNQYLAFSHNRSNAEFKVGSGGYDLVTVGGGGAVTIISDNRADSQDKAARLNMAHRLNATEEDISLFFGSATSGNNTAYFGGGSVSFNACTQLKFFTAPNTITTGGTVWGQLWEDGVWRFGDSPDSNTVGVGQLNIRTDAAGVGRTLDQVNASTNGAAYVESTWSLADTGGIDAIAARVRVTKEDTWALATNQDAALRFDVIADGSLVADVLTLNGVGPTVVVGGGLTVTDFSVAGFVKNTAAGVLSGGNSVTSTDITDFDEAAQDAVGGILADSATIDFTYNDVTPDITGIVIDDSISNAKLRNSAGFSVIGKATTGVGDPADIVAGDETVLGRTGAGSLAFTQVTTGQIANSAITFAKFQDIATDRLLGRDTAATGVVEEITVTGGLEFTGTGGIQRSALSGDVNVTAGSNTTIIASNAVTNQKLRDSNGFSVIGKSTTGSGDPADIIAGDETVLGRTGAGNLVFAQLATGQITDNAVTFAKLQDITTDRLLGRDTATTGDPEEITVGGGLEFTGTGGIQRSALTGDVTASTGSGATTISNNVVSDTKLRDSAALSVIGRASNSVGDPADIMTVADGDVLRRSGTTLGFGSLLSTSVSDFDEAAQDAVGNILTDTGRIDFTYDDVTPQITADIVANSLHVNHMTAFQGFVVFGKGTTGAGNAEEILAGTDSVLRRSGSGELNFGTLVTNHLGNNIVTDAKFRQSIGLSVVGRSSDITGDVADITAASDGDILRRSGLTLGFGTVVSSSVSDFDEAAQDAVGNILADTSSIDFAYDDGTPTISAVVLPAGVDHNSLANVATGDVHTQYALLAGRVGGQVLIGGTAANEDLTLQTTSNITKGSYFLTDLASNGFVKTQGGTGELTIDTSTYLTSELNDLETVCTGILANEVPVGSGTDVATYTGTTGTGNVVRAGSPTITTPTIASFANAAHNHQDAAGGGQLDHGLALTGLGDDDHTIYALLAGRAGGQILIGGTAAGEDLTLQTTSNVTKGSYFLTDLTSNGFVKTQGGTGELTIDTSTYLTAELNDLETICTGILTDEVPVGSGTNVATYTGTTGTGNVVRSGSPVITTPTIASFVNSTHSHQDAAGGGQLDHGLALTGLGDDDHTIYALLAGRAGGQVLIGGTGAGDDLTFQTTSNISLGSYFFSDLTSNGFVKTQGGTGELVIDTSTYLTAEQNNLEAVCTGILTDEVPVGSSTDVVTYTSTTGTGNVVRAGSPTLTTPSIASFANATHDHQTAAGGGQLDHGSAHTAGSLLDDDHTIYALLAGRASGQTLIGGTAISENLTLQSTANATRGEVISLDSFQVRDGSGEPTLSLYEATTARATIQYHRTDHELVLDTIELSSNLRLTPDGGVVSVGNNNGSSDLRITTDDNVAKLSFWQDPGGAPSEVAFLAFEPGGNNVLEIDSDTAVWVTSQSGKILLKPSNGVVHFDSSSDAYLQLDCGTSSKSWIGLEENDVLRAEILYDNINHYLNLGTSETGSYILMEPANGIVEVLGTVDAYLDINAGAADTAGVRFRESGTEQASLKYDALNNSFELIGSQSGSSMLIQSASTMTLKTGNTADIDLSPDSGIVSVVGAVDATLNIEADTDDVSTLGLRENSVTKAWFRYDGLGSFVELHSESEPVLIDPQAVIPQHLFGGMLRWSSWQVFDQATEDILETGYNPGFQGIANDSYPGAVFETEGYFAEAATGASTGDACGWIQIDVTRGNDAPLFFHARVKTGSSVADIRVYCGFVEAAQTSLGNSSLSTREVVCFEYDRGSSDTTWYMVTSNGTSQNRVDTGVTVNSNSVYELTIYVDPTGRAHFWIDGAKEGDSASNMPTTGLLDACVTAATLTTLSKSIKLQAANWGSH